MDRHRDQDEYGTGTDDGLAPLASLDVTASGGVDALVRAMGQTAFGGRRLSRAADVLEAMVRDEACFRVLTISGAMTNGLSEGTGHLHFAHDPRMRDEELYRKGYNRVYDTIELESNLDDVEQLLATALADLPDDAVLS